MKGGNMKYHFVVLLLMATLIIGVVVGGLLIVGFINLQQNTGDAPPQTITNSPTKRPTPRPVTSLAPSARDPIVGSWMNGMVFYENGTVGSEGTATWEINKNENNSYFVISDVLSPGSNNPRSVSSAEWIYSPALDKINLRGSSEFISRGMPTKKPTTKPTVTTIPTRQTQQVITANPNQGKFVYDDCTDACKLNYWADRNIGLYNDCIQTCNIENLKVLQ